jgi:hypothetical protein
MDSSTHAAVADATCQAAHRRDHGHSVHAPGCHPHAVEVVHLGDRAFAICHDCCADTGYLAERQAQRTAEEHRRCTAVKDVPLPRLAS